MAAKPEHPRTPTEVLHALQDLMTEASWKRGEAVHAALFGNGGIHADLVALAAKRPEFELRPCCMTRPPRSASRRPKRPS